MHSGKSKQPDSLNRVGTRPKNRGIGCSLDSIPKTHCDSPKRKSRIGTGDIGVISSTPTANGFAVITE